MSTGIAANTAEHAPAALPDPAHTTVDLGVPGQVEVMDATGRAVILTTDARGVLDVLALAPRGVHLPDDHFGRCWALRGGAVDRVENIV